MACDSRLGKMMIPHHADGAVVSPKLPYQTALSPSQEAEFQRYARLRPGYKFDPMPQGDYDERGQWLAQKKGLDPGGNWTQGQALTEDKADGPHGSDVWKTPYHRGFSNESKYAMTGREPSWNSRGQLQTPTGATVLDESGNEQKTAQMKALAGLLGIRKHADGAVVAPQQSTWERLWKAIMGREALKRAENPTAPPPMTPPASDNTDYVRKAAEEAGKRNEEEKRRQQQAGR